MLDLLAAAVCFATPWTAVVTFRLLPRRPPLTPGQSLALGLNPATESPGGAPPSITDAIPADPPGRIDPITKPKRRRLDLTLYQLLSFAANLTLLAVAFAMAFGIAFALTRIARIHAEGFPLGEIVFRPTALFGPYLVVGLGLSFFAALPLGVVTSFVLLGRRRFLDFLYWDEGRVTAGGMSPDGVIRLCTYAAWAVGTASAIFVWLSMNAYAVLTDDGVRVRTWYVPWERRYAYADVTEAVVSSHYVLGNSRQRGTGLGLRFADGSSWQSDGVIIHHLGGADPLALRDYLGGKGVAPVKVARLIADLPGW